MSDDILNDIGDSNGYGARNYAKDGWGFAEIKAVDAGKKTSGKKKRFSFLCSVLYHEPAEPGGPTHARGDLIDVGAKITGHAEDWARENDLGRIKSWASAILQPNFLAKDCTADDFKKALAGLSGASQVGRGVVVKFIVTKAGPKFREVSFEPVVPQSREEVKERRAAQDRGEKPAPWRGAPAASSAKTETAKAAEPAKTESKAAPAAESFEL